MKSRLSACILILALTSPTWAGADELTELRNGCSELVGIFVKRDKEKLLAAQTTSLSEALRAGYCRGVIIEYLRHSPSCGYTRNATVDWFEMALRISASDTADIPHTLQSAHCGY